MKRVDFCSMTCLATTKNTEAVSNGYNEVGPVKWCRTEKESPVCERSRRPEDVRGASRWVYKGPSACGKVKCYTDPRRCKEKTWQKEGKLKRIPDSQTAGKETRALKSRFGAKWPAPRKTEVSLQSPPKAKAGGTRKAPHSEGGQDSCNTKKAAKDRSRQGGHTVGRAAPCRPWGERDGHRGGRRGQSVKKRKGGRQGDNLQRTIAEKKGRKTG